MSPDVPSQTPSTPLTLLQATGAGRRIRNTTVTSELKRAVGRGNPQDTLEHCSPAPGRDPNCDRFSVQALGMDEHGPATAATGGVLAPDARWAGSAAVTSSPHLEPQRTAHRARNGGEPHTTRSPVAPRFLQRFPRAHVGPPTPSPGGTQAGGLWNTSCFRTSGFARPKPPTVKTADMRCH